MVEISEDPPITEFLWTRRQQILETRTSRSVTIINEQYLKTLVVSEKRHMSAQEHDLTHLLRQSGDFRFRVREVTTKLHDLADR